MKKPLTIILLFFSVSAYSQKCNCDSNFVWMQAYMQRNYPGFKSKVNPSTQSEYDANIKKYEPLIKQTDKPAYCEYLLKQWLKFFKDGHLQIYTDDALAITLDAKSETDTALVGRLNREAEIIDIDSAAFVKSLAKTESNSIEGIYTDNNSMYVIAIVKNKNYIRDYAGVMLSSKTKFWKRGEVKLELKQFSDTSYTMFMYMRNHTPEFLFGPVSLDADGRLDGSGWTRILPATKPKTTFKYKKDDDNSNVLFKNLDSKTSYLRIYSFDDQFRHDIDSTVRVHMHDINSHKNFVIDVRGNGGGSDGSFQCLLPIIYSNPVMSIGVDIYCTPDNAKAMQKMEHDDKYMSADDKRYCDSVIALINAHPYQFVSSGPDDTIKFDSVMHYPEKVAILYDRYCGSTTEQFLMYAKDFRKVTLMGENSYGVLDYSNVRPVDFPAMPGIVFGYPITLSRRIALHQGIDGVGIPPKIKLKEGSDWIKAAQEYLEKN